MFWKVLHDRTSTIGNIVFCGLCKSFVRHNTNRRTSFLTKTHSTFQSRWLNNFSTYHAQKSIRKNSNSFRLNITAAPHALHVHWFPFLFDDFFALCVLGGGIFPRFQTAGNHHTIQSHYHFDPIIHKTGKNGNLYPFLCSSYHDPYNPNPEGACCCILQWSRTLGTNTGKPATNPHRTS